MPTLVNGLDFVLKLSSAIKFAISNFLPICFLLLHNLWNRFILRQLGLLDFFNQFLKLLVLGLSLF